MEIESVGGWRANQQVEFGDNYNISYHWGLQRVNGRDLEIIEEIYTRNVITGEDYFIDSINGICYEKYVTRSTLSLKSAY